MFAVPVPASETVAVAETVAAPGHAGATRSAEVPGTALCWYNLPAMQRLGHNDATGQPTGMAMRYGYSGSEGGRRRASSAVATLQSTTQATPLLGRRWNAVGGPEGRSRGVRCLRDPFASLRLRACDVRWNAMESVSFCVICGLQQRCDGLPASICVFSVRCGDGVMKHRPVGSSNLVTRFPASTSDRAARTALGRQRRTRRPDKKEPFCRAQ